MSRFDKSLYIARLHLARMRGLITSAAEDVAHSLLGHCDWQDGGCGYPSRATLATEAGCSTRHVSRCLVQLRDAGYVSWIRRRVRWNKTTTNLYQLHTPEVPPVETKRAGITVRQLGMFKRGLATTVVWVSAIAFCELNRLQRTLRVKKVESCTGFKESVIESPAKLPPPSKTVAEVLARVTAYTAEEAAAAEAAAADFPWDVDEDEDDGPAQIIED